MVTHFHPQGRGGASACAHVTAEKAGAAFNTLEEDGARGFFRKARCAF